MGEWIKCSDMLPGDGLVLAYAPINAAETLGPVSVQQARSLLWWHGNYPDKQFTHWMPLPADPALAKDAPHA